MSDTITSLRYELSLPNRVLFGWGCRWDIGSLARDLGNVAICVYGSRTLEQSGVMVSFEESLRKNGVTIAETLRIAREPTILDVDDAVRQVRATGKTKAVLLAVGGGAAIDLAKAVAGLTPQPHFETVQNYLEGVGRGFTFEAEPLPVLAVPTTAGTGSEATKNAVIASYDPPFKKSLRDERLIPKIVLLDPELTVSCPAKVTAESGMDAITQLFESYVSRKSQPLTKVLCEQGLVAAWHSLLEAVNHPTSQTARENMMHAAFLSGVCLANAGLGMAHGIAPALGSLCRIPHGAACALLLPLTLRTNAEVCRGEYARLARLLLVTEKCDTSDEVLVERLIEEVEKLCRSVGIAGRLSDFGVTSDQLPAIAAESFGSSMQGNPRILTQEELAGILFQN